MIAQIGDKTSDVFDCTTFHKVNFNELLDWYIMNIPRFLEMDDLDLKVTKEQAIRLNVQQALKVKIVFFANHKNLDEIREIIRAFANILKSICVRGAADVLICFLFSKFSRLEGLAKETSLADEEQSKIIREIIRKKTERSIDAIA